MKSAFMKRTWHRLRHPSHRRGSIAVEIALILSFFLLPLMLGTVDFAYIMSARIQLNAALQTAEVFAWANQDEAADGPDIAPILNGGSAVAQISQPSPPTMSYSCLQNDGSVTAASVVMNSGYSSADLATPQASEGLAEQKVPASSESIGKWMGTATCSAGSVQANVTYVLSTTISLPVYLPSIGTQSVQTIRGTIWVR